MSIGGPGANSYNHPLSINLLGNNQTEFVNRSEEIEYIINKIKLLLNKKSSYIIFIPVSGPPGSGKTTLLYYYSKLIKNKYKNILIFEYFDRYEAIEYGLLDIIFTNKLKLTKINYKIRLSRFIRKIEKKLSKIDVVIDIISPTLPSEPMSSYGAAFLSILLKNIFNNEVNIKNLKRYFSIIDNLFRKFNNDTIIFIFDDLYGNINFIGVFEIFILLPLLLLKYNKKALIIFSFSIKNKVEISYFSENYNRYLKYFINIFIPNINNKLSSNIEVTEIVFLKQLPKDDCINLVSKKINNLQTHYKLYSNIPFSPERICEINKYYPMLINLFINLLIARKFGQPSSMVTECCDTKSAIDSNDIKDVIKEEIFYILDKVYRENKDLYKFFLFLLINNGKISIEKLKQYISIHNIDKNKIINDPNVEIMFNIEKNYIKINHLIYLDLILIHIIKSIKSTKKGIFVKLALDEFSDDIKTSLSKRIFNPHLLVLTMFLNNNINYFMEQIYKYISDSSEIKLVDLSIKFEEVDRLLEELLREESSNEVVLSHIDKINICKFYNLYSDILLRVGNQYKLQKILIRRIKRICSYNEIPIDLWLSLVDRLLSSLNYVGKSDEILNIYREINNIIEKVNLTEADRLLLVKFAYIIYNIALAYHTQINYIRNRGEMNDIINNALIYYIKASKYFVKAGYSYKYKKLGLMNNIYMNIPLPKIRSLLKFKDDHQSRFYYLLIPSQIIHLISSIDKNMAFRLMNDHLKIILKYYLKYNKLIDRKFIQLIAVDLSRYAILLFELSPDPKNKINAISYIGFANKLVSEYDIDVIKGPILCKKAKILKYFNKELYLSLMYEALNALYKVDYLYLYIKCYLDFVNELINNCELLMAKALLKDPKIKSTLKKLNNKFFINYYKELNERVENYDC